MTTAEDIIDRARRTGGLIAAAESCTGGLLMAGLTAVPGASDVVDRGFVTYSNAAKHEMLAVRASTLDAHGAVSTQVAEEMARGALSHSNATLAVSITGIAGPGGSEHKPEGRVCFGIATKDAVHSETVEFGAIGRDAVRARSVGHALALLGRALPPAP